MKLTKENLRECFPNPLKFKFSNIEGINLLEGFPALMIYENTQTGELTYGMGLVENMEELEHDAFEIPNSRVVGIANLICEKVWQFEPEDHNQAEIVSVELTRKEKVNETN